MERRPVRLRLGAAVATAVLLTAAAAAALIGHIGERTMEDAAAESLRSAAGLFAAMERGDIQKLSATLDALLDREELRQAFVERDRDKLLALAAPLFRVLRERDGITHLYFIEPSRTCFLRVHKPELFGDRIERATLARAAETGGSASGMELGQTAFALRVVRPWVHQGRLIGFLELAEEINHFLVRMKKETGNDFGLLALKKYLDEAAWSRIVGRGQDTWGARHDVVVVDTTTFTEGIIDYQGSIEAIPDAGLLLDEEVRDGKAWIRGIFPMRDAADRRVGALVVLHDFTATHGLLGKARTQAALVVLGLAALNFALAWLALEWMLFRRLRRATRQLETQTGAPRTEGDELMRLEALTQGRQADARQPDAAPTR